MQYPLDKSEFIQWVKRQSPNTLLDLKLELLASQADLQIQLQNHSSHSKGYGNWTTRAKVKLRLTEWRLEATNLLLEQSSLAFQRAALKLLDEDTYRVILEAAQSGALNATRAN